MSASADAMTSLAAERTFGARRNGWWFSAVMHGSAVVALVLVGARGKHAAVDLPPSVVEFEAPRPATPRVAQPPPPPPAPPPDIPTPQPAVHRTAVHHDQSARAARTVAAPPIITAAASHDTGSHDSVESGNNTGYQGGDVGTPHEAPPAPTPAPAPATPSPPVAPVARGPVQLPEDADPPEPDTHNALPEYPPSARASGLQTTVVARIVVNDDGSVGRVEILRGHPEFNAAVEAALRHWRYRPARVDGHPLAVFQVVRVPFRLENM